MQASPPSPPSQPSPPSAPSAQPGAPVPVVVGTNVGSASPAELYTALRAQRRELSRQLETLEGRRQELSERLKEPMVGGADRKGLEQRIADVDQRISEVDKQIAASDRELARVTAIPGATVEPPQPRRSGPPDEFLATPALFIVLVLFPLALAYTRRLWRRGSDAVAALPAELWERLTRLEQATDTIAVEVERISEGQRFMSRLFAEGAPSRAVGAGAAQPVEVKAGQPVPRSVRG